MGADSLKSQAINRRAAGTQRYKYPQHSIAAHETSLRATDCADAGFLNLLLAGNAGCIRYFSSYTILRIFPLETVGLAKDNNLAAGRQ